MIIKSTTAYILHLGDVRIYRLRDNILEQLTKDHRVWISADKSYLSRAMGIDSVLSPDYETFEVEKDDVYLFMTDGVYEFLDQKFMKESLNQNIDDYDLIAKRFIDTALENNSDDNLTIQIVKIDNIPNKNVEEIHKQLIFRPLPPILEARMNFDGYNIIRELSHSSRSHIYLAVDEESKKDVVIKIPSVDLKDDKAYLERFMMEEWIARRISSPYVVKSYLQTRKRNYLYNVTEFIEGQTLTKWMIDNPNTKIDEVRNITEQIAKGLNSFHKQEMIHQDLRPENIMIDKINTIKIIDFGATRVEGILEINTSIEQENLQGTALYSAPEYFLGEEGTNKSDIFSLGVIVYQMISGSFPYGTNVAKCTNRTAQNKLTYNSLYPKVPIWIDEAIKKAVHIDPHKRYEQLTEFIYDLKKPNKKFLNKKRPPLIERSPEKFWQGISLILFIIILFLLLK
jgi:protein phosphatase